MKAKNNVRAFSRLVLSLFCVVLCSCEGDEIDPAQAGKALQLRAEITGMNTRATDAAWEKDDAIGVYMVKSGQPLNPDAIRRNVMYVTSGSSAFHPADEAEEIIFPFDGSPVDFISYYPYRENIDDFVYPVDLGDQSVQSDIDLMYSDNAEGASSKEPNAQMQFTHRLSKLVLNLPSGLENLSVILSGAATRASFDLSSGELSGATGDENIELWVNPGKTVAEAILLPGEALSDMCLWFITDDGTGVYKFSLSNLDIHSFAAATKYTCNVSFSTDGTAVVTEGDISGWIEHPSQDITAPQTNEPPPVPSTKGTEDSPFNVAEAQGNSGKTGVWVEGYIVGSFKSTTINSFSPDPAEASGSNLALADNQNETDISNILPVQLPTGRIRDALSLQQNPDNFGKKVMIKGNIDSYFSAIGLRDIKDYRFSDPE